MSRIKFGVREPRPIGPVTLQTSWRRRSQPGPTGSSGRLQRRAWRELSKSARASSVSRPYTWSGRWVEPRDGSALLAFLQPAQAADVTLAFPPPPNVRDVRLVVVEGDGGFGPGTFEIGGEGSVLHARAGWPLT